MATPPAKKKKKKKKKKYLGMGEQEEYKWPNWSKI